MYITRKNYVKALLLCKRKKNESILCYNLEETSQKTKLGSLKIKILSCTMWFTDLFSCFHLEQRFEVG